MDEYQSLIGIISLTLGVSWASGINLYATMLMLGLAGATGNVELPSGLETLENPLVIAAAGLMYATEFFADKVPGVDSTWDALHTFVRIPAGAMLAMGAVGDVSPAFEVAAAMLGGGLSATSHAAKAGTRLAVNTSPEPFTNWGLSVTEDIAVFAGLWAALNHPWVFIGLLILFIAAAIWLLPRLWRAIRFIFRRIGQFLGLVDKSLDADPGASPGPFRNPVSEPVPAAGPMLGTGSQERSDEAASVAGELGRLKKLLDQGAITKDEYDTLKGRLIG